MSGEYIFTKIVNLPEGYTQLEYIENTGTQYIQGSISGLSNNENIKLELYSYNYTADGGFFSLLNSTSNNRSFYTGYGFANAIYVASYPNRIFFTVSNTAATGEHIIERKSDKSIYIDGTLATATAASATWVDFSNVNSFCVGKSSATSAILPARYKRITITGKLDLIPAKRNSDNVLGMYDTVTDTFFTNAGTGTFTAGDEVVEEVGDKYYGVIPVADYKDICDAVREKTHTDALMLPPEVAAKIRSINPTPTPGEWVRPDGWPDLDAVNLTGFDGVYLTYDLTKTEGYGWIGLYATTADRTSWTVERGHLEAGQFVAERTEQVANNGHFREPLDDTYGTIQLWRVSASGHITELKFVTLTATNASNMNNNLQPCVERVGRLPYVGNFSSNFGTVQTSRCCGTLWMQHDKLLDVSSVTTLVNAWNSCCSLQSLYLSGWDTGSVTNMSGAWQNCYSLQSLNLSGWDTGSLTALQNAWNACYSLQSLNISEWDVSSVTTLASAWQNCYSLQSLDISEWDVSSVTTMAYAWNGCYSLQSLDLSGWDTESLTTMHNAWNGCYSLQSLNLSGWDVSSVTTLQNAWANCNSLQSLNLSGWDVSHLSTNVAYPNGSLLADYWPSVISINQNYSSAAALSIASLLRIIDSLPVATGARTLTLGQTNKLKLTAEQIAVATQKGWTVA